MAIPPVVAAVIGGAAAEAGKSLWDFIITDQEAQFNAYVATLSPRQRRAAYEALRNRRRWW
jgi:hypothetical protein